MTMSRRTMFKASAGAAAAAGLAAHSADPAEAAGAPKAQYTSAPTRFVESGAGSSPTDPSVPASRWCCSTASAARSTPGIRSSSTVLPLRASASSPSTIRVSGYRPASGATTRHRLSKMQGADHSPWPEGCCDWRMVDRRHRGPDLSGDVRAGHLPRGPDRNNASGQAREDRRATLL